MKLLPCTTNRFHMFIFWLKMNFLLGLLLTCLDILTFVLTEQSESFITKFTIGRIFVVNARPEISNETVLTIYKQIKDVKLKAVILNMYQNMKSDDERYYIRFECAFSSIQRYLRYAYETKEPKMNRLNVINRKDLNGSRLSFNLSIPMQNLIYGHDSEFDPNDQARFKKYFKIWYVYTKLGNSSSSICFQSSLNNFSKNKQNHRPGVDQIYKSFAFNMARLFLLSGKIYSAKRHRMYTIFSFDPNKIFLQVLFEAWPEYFIHSDSIEYLNILQYCLNCNLTKFHSIKTKNPYTNKSVVIPQSRACPRQTFAFEDANDQSNY